LNPDSGRVRAVSGRVIDAVSSYVPVKLIFYLNPVAGLFH